MFSSYLVYGLGISGLNLAKYLIKKGDKVFLIDDNEKSIAVAKQALQGFEGFEFLQFDEILTKIDKNSAIIFSPGIPLYFPKRHKILDVVSASGCALMCDVELFYLLNKNHKFIGITGSNGKSTTSTLIYFILREIGINSCLAGNIGIACFDLMLNHKIESNTNFVLEISSYQLDLMNRACLGVAALTNITPDHIDRHGSFENYILAKKKIFQNQELGDFAVINIDNENAKKIYDELKNSKRNLIAVSAKSALEKGVSVVDGFLYVDAKKYSIKNAILKGEHNMQNIAIAVACVYANLLQNNLLQNDTITKIAKAIEKFKGLRHRLQFLGNVDGVNFINDSKATNAESSEKALQAYDHVFWILGGLAKEGGINILKPYFSKVIKAYLIGKASEDFAKVLQENGVKFEKCDNLENAFKKSFFDAKNAGLKERNILLSPACASFDQWKNFEERGDYFCKKFDEIAKP